MKQSWSCLCLERCDYSLNHHVQRVDGVIVRDLEREWLKISWEGQKGKKYVDRSLIWSKDVTILISHVNTHQKVSSVEQTSSNHVGWMRHFVGSQPCPQPYVSFSNGPMNISAAVKHWGLCVSTTVRSSTHQAWWMPDLLSHRYGTASCVSQLVTWWQVDYIGSFHTGKVQSFLLAYIHVLPMILTFMHIFLLLKPLSVDTLSASFTTVAFHTILLLTKESVSQKKPETVIQRSWILILITMFLVNMNW